jgi:hypothetical protein
MNGDANRQEGKKSMTQEQQQEIRRLRAMGEGYKRIGAILNLSVNTVKSFCRRDSAVNPPQFREKGNQAACLRCGRPLVLIPGRRKRLFCSDACRMAYWRTQAYPKEKARRCAGCGRLLMGNDPQRKYCGHACYIAHRFGKGDGHAG